MFVRKVEVRAMRTLTLENYGSSSSLLLEVLWKALEEDIPNTSDNEL